MCICLKSQGSNPSSMRKVSDYYVFHPPELVCLCLRFWWTRYSLNVLEFLKIVFLHHCATVFLKFKLGVLMTTPVNKFQTECHGLCCDFFSNLERAVDVSSDLEGAEKIVKNLVLRLKEGGYLPSSKPLDSAPCPEAAKGEYLLALKVQKYFFSAVIQIAEHYPDQRPQIDSFLAHAVKTLSLLPIEDLSISLELLPEWIEEILACQKIFKPFLPQHSLEEGSCKGALYKIQKEGQTQGYLLRTFQEEAPEFSSELTKASGDIFKKLSKCAIICTKPTSSSSVHESLMNVAEIYGITNFGAIPLLDKADQAQDPCTGRSIDTFLTAAEVMGKNKKEAPHKSFFVIRPEDSSLENVSSTLAQKGWTLELSKR